ncbi:MAG: hypothetical protein K1X55_10040 [Chitinophagales bacterium]|nr:hypothetical protein [Chitinophagales bacterium]
MKNLKNRPGNLSEFTIKRKPKFTAQSIENKDLDLILQQIKECCKCTCKEEPVVVKDPNVKLTISVDMYVEDDETFSSNETARRQKSTSAILSQRGVNQSLMEFEVRMGGEIRVELSLTGYLIDQYGNVNVDGVIKLYEGTSESTGDLDGSRTFTVFCPVGNTTGYFVRVNNDDEGGDYSTAQISISTVIV